MPPTARQLEILALSGRGLNAVDIGRELWISPRTVEQHLRNIREVFEVSTTRQAVVIAVSRGMLSIDHSTEQIDFSTLRAQAL